MTPIIVSNHGGEIMKTIIHVNQHIIKANAKNGTNNPPLTVKTYKEGINCHEVAFIDGIVIHRPEKPLGCGAKLWIETQEPVKIIR
mgnify:FL=1|tara:strand:- start:538 stop:795 length:258 start_codon:yes stop_codon:yes gene_type:complete